MWRFQHGRGEILTLICFLGVGFTPLSADEGREIYKRTVRATAWVRTSASTGTGWVVDRSRKLLVTNHHVVLNEDKVNLVFPAYKNGKLLAGRSDYKDALGILGRV